MSEVKTSRDLAVSEILRGDPCWEYSERLRERFAEIGTIPVTVELAVSQADDWDWYWAAARLLTAAGYEKFQRAVTEAENKRADALKPYRDLARQAREEARREYDRVLAIEVEKPGNWYSDAAYRAANVAYDQVTKVSEAALQGARKVVQGDVNKVAAETFATLYIGEEGTTDQTGMDKWYGRDTYEDDDYNDYEDDNDY